MRRWAEDGGAYDLNTKTSGSPVKDVTLHQALKRIEFLEEKITELELKNAQMIANINVIKEKTHLSSIEPQLEVKQF